MTGFQSICSKSFSLYLRVDIIESYYVLAWVTKVPDGIEEQGTRMQYSKKFLQGRIENIPAFPSPERYSPDEEHDTRAQDLEDGYSKFQMM